MTQSQFMYDLMIALEGVPDEEKFVMMNDYTRYFEDKLAEGMSEESIVSSLKSPREIARRYKNGNPIPIDGVESVLTSNPQGKKTFSSIFKFVLLVPVCAVYEVLAVGFGIVMLAAILVLCMACALGGVVSFVSVALNKGFLLLGIGAVFLTFALVMLFMIVFRFSVDSVKFFPALMGRILSNKPKERK